MDFDAFLASIEISRELASSANLTREVLCTAQRARLTPRERLSERFRSLPQLRLGVRLRLTHHLHELSCDGGGEAGSPRPATTPQPRAGRCGRSVASPFPMRCAIHHLCACMASLHPGRRDELRCRTNRIRIGFNVLRRLSVVVI